LRYTVPDRSQLVDSKERRDVRTVNLDRSRGIDWVTSQSGHIHEELEVTSELPIGEAMVKMAYALYDMGKAFARRCPTSK
jgi:hypothetical protein